jgi:hypothetical protein
VPNFPRLRALALFGRRLPRRVEAPVIPASENQHTSRHMHRSKFASFDHIVGAPEVGEREADTERLGGRRQAAC